MPPVAVKVWVKVRFVKPTGEKFTVGPSPLVELADTPVVLVVVLKVPSDPVMLAAAVENVRPFFSEIVYDKEPLGTAVVIPNAEVIWAVRVLPEILNPRKSVAPPVRPERDTPVTSNSAPEKSHPLKLRSAQGLAWAGLAPMMAKVPVARTVDMPNFTAL
jgi:hypothetical protein